MLHPVSQGQEYADPATSQKNDTVNGDLYCDPECEFRGQEYHETTPQAELDEPKMVLQAFRHDSHRVSIGTAFTAYCG